MIINIIAVGKKLPAWAVNGYNEYAKRMPSDYKLNLVGIPPIKHTKVISAQQIKQKEGERILAAVPKHSLIIAMDEHGKQCDTVKLSQQLQNWRENWQSVSLLIGGAEGLSTKCLKKAQLKWSLSSLTLPHAMVRVILAEQLYRAWSIITKHPYHRV